MPSSILNCSHPTLCCCCRPFLVTITWIAVIPWKTDRVTTIGARHLPKTRRKDGLCPQELAVTLKLSFIDAWKGDLVWGVRVMVQTDGWSYSVLLKTHPEEKDTAAIQSPLNIGLFQYLVRSVHGQRGVRQSKGCWASLAVSEQHWYKASSLSHLSDK